MKLIIEWWEADRLRRFRTSFADFYSHKLEVPVPNAILARDIIGARPVLPGVRIVPSISNLIYRK